MNLSTTKRKTTDSAGLLYKHIANTLREEIRTQYQRNDMLPTQRELAQRFKISCMTVGNALQQLVQEGLVTRTPGVGTFVRDPQNVTRGLVGIMTACKDPIYMTRLFGTIEQELRQAQYRPIVFGSSGVYQEELNALNEMGRFNEVGLILYSPFIPKLLEETENIRQHKIPVVTINRPCGDFDCSRVDHRQIGVLQAQYLLTQSCRRILYIDASGSIDSVTPWLDGFLSVLIQKGGGLPTIRLAVMRFAEGATHLECDAAARQHTQESVRQAFTDPGEPAPDAIVVCGGDQYLPAVVEVLRELKREPGRDVRLVGQDNQNIQGFPYATVDECLDEIGHHATRLLLDRIEGRYSGLPRTHVVSPKLVQYD